MARTREALERSAARHAEDLRRLEAFAEHPPEDAPLPYDSWDEVYQLQDLHRRWLDEDEDELAVLDMQEAEL